MVVLDTTSPGAVDAAMPQARAFAEGGRRYTRAWSSSNSTMEAVAGVFVGAWMSAARLWEADLVTLPETLKEAGYSTYFGSANIVLDHPFYARGADVAEARAQDLRRDFPDLGAVERFEQSWATLEGPRFGWLQLAACHDYRVAGKDYIGQGPPRGEAALKEAHAAYLLDCAATDALLPRVFAANPGGLTILTADHGELFGHLGSYPLRGQAEHGHGLGSSPLELHIPLALQGPGVVPGVDDRPASLLEVRSTVLQAAGLDDGRGDLRSGRLAWPPVAAACHLNDGGPGDMTALLQPDGSQLLRTAQYGMPELVRWEPAGVGLKDDWSAVDPAGITPDQRRLLFDAARLLCVSDEDLCRQHPELVALGYIDCP